MNFEEAWTNASKVGGLLTETEARELWRTTQNPGGEVVDLGCGTRACILLAAVGPITSSIPFDEFDEHSYASWRDQIINSGHAPNIYVIKEDDNAYHTWEHPVGHLLMGKFDARQLNGWKIHLVTGAAVTVFTHLNQVPTELPDDFKVEKTVGNITTLRYSPKVDGQQINF